MFSPLFFQGCAVPWVLMHSVVSSDSKFTILKTEASPRTLEWVAYAFSSRSSPPRNWTRVSCIAGGFFTNWALREALEIKCTVDVICLNHPQIISQPLESMWKLSSTKLVPGAKKVGDHWFRALVLTSCVTLGKLCYLSEPQFPHVQNGYYLRTYHIKLLQTLK